MAIIIPSRSFCFVKVPKTAGSSIEAYLSQFISEPYISSPQGPVAEMDKIMRGGVASYGYKQAVYESTGDYIRKVIARWRKAPQELGFLYQIYKTESTKEKIDTAIKLALSQANVHAHMTLGELERFIDKKFPDRHFSFHGFIRNPYDHAFSHFAYLLTRTENPTLIPADELIERFHRFLRDSYEPQKNWLTSDRSSCEIYKFERLHEEAQRLRSLVSPEAQMTNIDSGDRFPQLLENRYKSFFRSLKNQLLDVESRELISRACQWEFENYYPDSI